MRSRAFTFTINTYTDEDLDQLLGLESRYLVFGFEKGSKTQREHLQCYAYFDTLKSIAQMHEMIPRAKFFISKGTAEQNFNYNSKEHDYYEFGEMPQQGHLLWDKMEAVMENPQENFALYAQYSRKYNEVLKQQREKLNEDIRILQVIAEENWPEFAVKGDTMVLDSNTELDTYNGEQILIILNAEYTNYNIKNWFLGYPPRIRRGYEIIKVNPNYIYLVYTNPLQKSKLKKICTIFI